MHAAGERRGGNGGWSRPARSSDRPAVAADLAERGGRTGSALWRWRPLAYLAEALAAEGDRRILWLPVFFAMGIALYFTPTVEPPWWLGLAATAAALIPAILFRRRPVLRHR